MIPREALIYEQEDLPHRSVKTDAEMQVAATAFCTLIEQRHTVQDFADRPVARAVIETCVRAAGHAPSGANQQPWFFAAVSDPELLRRHAEACAEIERAAPLVSPSNDWLSALGPVDSIAHRPYMAAAPWLIVVFQRSWGHYPDGSRYKKLVPAESTWIAAGVLITALHFAGLACLPYVPRAQAFLRDALGRPASEAPVFALAVGHPADDAKVPRMSKNKKALPEILEVFEGPGPARRSQ